SRLAALQAEIGIALTQRQTLASLLQTCTRALVRHLDVALARIWTLTGNANALELQASAGFDTHLGGPKHHVPVGRLKVGLSAQVRKPHVTNALTDDPLLGDLSWAQRYGLVAFAGHPLIVEDRLVGVLGMYACQPFSTVLIDSLSAVADAIALGIQRKQAE